MLLEIRQWEKKYIRDFQPVVDGEILEEHLYTKLIAMYYDYVSKNSIEPFTISYGRGMGFFISANSHVGVIIYEDIVLYITSMVPDLTLGKIIYLQTQAEETTNNSITKNLLVENLNDEESVSAVDYFIVSLVNVFEDIKQNGLLTEFDSHNVERNRIVGQLDLSRQIQHYPAYDLFCVKKTESDSNIQINKIIKTAISKARDITSLEWLVPFLSDAEGFLCGVDILDDIEADDFPMVDEYTSIKREDYEKALRFSKYILLGYDPLSGGNSSFFPEFMLDMNVVFELYVTTGLKRIFKTGFENKKVFSLGLGPNDVPISDKYIELDGYYEKDNVRVVLDTKNKYRSVIDRQIPNFMAENPDIYQQYYYASRVNAKHIILVYPSSKKRSKSMGKYTFPFEGNKEVDMHLWALPIAGTPKENKQALVQLAIFMEGFSE